jgi:hypothetical protein
VNQDALAALEGARDAFDRLREPRQAVGRREPVQAGREEARGLEGRAASARDQEPGDGNREGERIGERPGFIVANGRGADPAPRSLDDLLGWQRASPLRANDRDPSGP